MISLLRHTAIFRYVILVVCLLYMNMVNADVADMCHYHQALKNGLDMTAFHHCETAIKSCPTATLFHDKKCVNAQLSKQFCQQLSFLAEILKVDAEMISIKSTDHYATISVHYPADGALQYYILSPRGCLLNTSIDPSAIDKNFQREFAGQDLYIDAGEPPSFRRLPDDRKQFIVHVEGRDQCRACSVLVAATIGFTFNGDGEWVGVSLIRYHEPLT